MLARKERKKNIKHSRKFGNSRGAPAKPSGSCSSLRWSATRTTLLWEMVMAHENPPNTVFLWHRCFLTSTCLSFAVDLQSVVWNIPSCVGASHVPRSRSLRAFSLLALITSLQNTDLMQNHGRGDCGCLRKILRQVSIPSALPLVRGMRILFLSAAKLYLLLFSAWSFEEPALRSSQRQRKTLSHLRNEECWGCWACWGCWCLLVSSPRAWTL